LNEILEDTEQLVEIYRMRAAEVHRGHRGDGEIQKNITHLI